jgi:hypothetical protein
MAFHVPEAARDSEHPIYGSTEADGNNGAFHLPSPEPGWQLGVLASDGEGWEHVSVHAYKREGKQQRTPTWREMTFIKNQFWGDEDIVIQFHPRRSEYVNLHPHTLHLWRPTNATIPTPPPILVGVLA